MKVAYTSTWECIGCLFYNGKPIANVCRFINNPLDSLIHCQLYSSIIPQKHGHQTQLSVFRTKIGILLSIFR